MWLNQIQKTYGRVAILGTPHGLLKGELVLKSIVTSAPGRCGIVGNPTDMYGGSVISCTVQERAECGLTAPADALLIDNEGSTAVLKTRDDLRLRGDTLDIARAALMFFELDPAQHRFALHLRTDIP